jgi:acyl carrier protein phosphodiesterase
VNYLAHLYLAGDDDERIAGALLGDFVKGRLENLPLAPGLVEGIRLHRAIDVFTDAHPTVIRSRVRLQQRRRVAGIIVDLAYDHFLAVRWREFTDEPLTAFCTRSYRRLLARIDEFPPGLRDVLPRMAAYDWLGSYAELGNVALALERIGTRLRRPAALAGVLEDLECHYRGLEQDFLDFFPQLESHVAERIGGA